MCLLRRPQKLTKSSPLIWHLLHNVKLTVKILSNFVAFLENINFNKITFLSERISTHYTIAQQVISSKIGLIETWPNLTGEKFLSKTFFISDVCQKCIVLRGFYWSFFRDWNIGYLHDRKRLNSLFPRGFYFKFRNLHLI